MDLNVLTFLNWKLFSIAFKYYFQWFHFINVFLCLFPLSSLVYKYSPQTISLHSVVPRRNGKGRIWREIFSWVHFSSCFFKADYPLTSTFHPSCLAKKDKNLAGDKLIILSFVNGLDLDNWILWYVFLLWIYELFLA